MRLILDQILVVKYNTFAFFGIVYQYWCDYTMLSLRSDLYTYFSHLLLSKFSFAAYRFQYSICVFLL